MSQIRSNVIDGERAIRGCPHGIGGCLGEIITDLKEKPDTRPLIDRLNRQFANLRDVAPELSGALVDPVIQRLCDELDEVGGTHSDLAAKCEDLEEQLRDFASYLSNTDGWDTPDWDDEDIPF